MIRGEKEEEQDQEQISLGKRSWHQSEEVPNEVEKKEPQNQAKVKSSFSCQNIPYVPVPPFPSRLIGTRKEDDGKEVLETFRKVKSNIPLLDAIKQIPKYAKCLKEMCTTKKKLKSDEEVSVGENVSALIKKSLPIKCKDPGMFTLPCGIGNMKIENAMLDLGASINVMPYSIYRTLNLGHLKETNVHIQLADRSYVYPEGVVEDVLVQVDELIFPADFYILKMENDSLINSAPIILGRPFMKTSKTKIDVSKGVLSVEFGGEIVRFKTLDAIKYPIENQSLCFVDAFDLLEKCVANENGGVQSLDVQEHKEGKDEHSRMHKDEPKLHHNNSFSKSKFVEGNKVLLYHSCRTLSGKLWSQWLGPFVILNVFPNGSVKIKNLKTSKIMKVTEHRLKLLQEDQGMSYSKEAELKNFHPFPG